MRAIYLSILLAAASGLQGGETHLAAPCAPVWDRTTDVMQSLGFEIIGGRSMGTTVIFQHAYNTREWKTFAAKAGQVAQTGEGLLVTVHGLRPYRAEVHYYDVNIPGWRDGTRSCLVRIDMDWAGWKRSFFSDGPERFKSTGSAEERIALLFRESIRAAGLLNLVHQDVIDRQTAEEREKPPTQ
jgi:hypothetical protein